MKTVLLTGATSQIGPYLIDQLLGQNYTVHAVTRSQAKVTKQNQNLSWHILSGTNKISDIIESTKPDTWISVGPLAMVSDYLTNNKNSSLRRIIGTSSTGVLTKANSKNQKEQNSIRALLESENIIKELCQKFDINYTIFRPTLVYSNGRDKNISVIVSLIKKFNFFPVWNNGKGLRQPIHAEDIATAITSSISNTKTFNQTYTLSGGNILTYRQMVEVLFHALGKKPRVINMPYFVLATAIKSLSAIPKYRYLNTEMLSRINDNLNFDHEKAKIDFNFSPRDFNPNNVGLNNTEL